jgi:hypothetical protein
MFDEAVMQMVRVPTYRQVPRDAPARTQQPAGAQRVATGAAPIKGDRMRPFNIACLVALVAVGPSCFSPRAPDLPAVSHVWCIVLAVSVPVTATLGEGGCMMPDELQLAA